MNTLVAAIMAGLMLALPMLADAGQASLDTVDVYIVPMEDFPEGGAAAIAKSMSEDMKLWVKGTLRMGALGVATLPGTNQLVSEEILEKSQPVLKRLPESSGKTYYLLLTTRDINSRTGATRFQFSAHSLELNTSVISLARLLYDAGGHSAAERTIQARLYKMVKRAIGEMRLGWKRSTNIADVMYSPIMSLQDLDRIGTDHAETPSNGEQDERGYVHLPNAI